MEDTVRHDKEINNIFRRKFCVCNNDADWILPSELSCLTLYHRPSPPLLPTFPRLIGPVKCLLKNLKIIKEI